MKKRFCLFLAMAFVLTLALSGCQPSPVPTPTPSEMDVIGAYSPSVCQVLNRANSGSGFVLARDGEHAIIATCYHVVGNESAAVRVRFYGNSDYVGGAEIFGYSERYDVTLLKIAIPAGLDLTLSSISESSVSIGDKVFAIGNALDMGIAAVDGIVSIAEEVALIESYNKPIMRVTAPFEAGMSGAPVFSENGKLVGMAQAKYYLTDGTPIEGFNYALPAEILLALYNRAVKSERAGDVSGVTVSYFSEDVTLENNIISKQTGFTVTVGTHSAKFDFTSGKLVLLSATNVVATLNTAYSTINGSPVPTSLAQCAALFIGLDPAATIEFGGADGTITI